MLTSRRFAAIPQLEQAANSSPSLGNGSRGEGVAALQDALYDLGYALMGSFAKAGRPDAIFGPETEKAVKAFQKNNGLVQDGAAGRKSIAALDSIIAADPRLDAPDPARLERSRLANWKAPARLRSNQMV